MYGAQQNAAAGAVLATTGAASGAGALAAVGILLIALAVVALIRRNGKNRP